MSDHDALLHAIISNPDDDTSRLVFADWCEENGNPLRAEFIRLGFELDRTGLKDCPRQRITGSVGTYPSIWARCGRCDFCRPMQRLRELLNTDPPVPGLWPRFACAASVEVVPDLCSSKPSEPFFNFRKGFIEQILLPLDQWLKPYLGSGIFGSHVVRSCPIRRVEVSDREPRPVEFMTDWGTVFVLHVWEPTSRVTPAQGSERIPDPIFSLLTGNNTRDGPPDGLQKRYVSSKKAHDALSDALLRVAHDPDFLIDPDPKQRAAPRHAYRWLNLKRPPCDTSSHELDQSTDALGRTHGPRLARR